MIDKLELINVCQSDCTHSINIQKHVGLAVTASLGWVAVFSVNWKMESYWYDSNLIMNSCQHLVAGLV